MFFKEGNEVWRTEDVMRRKRGRKFIEESGGFFCIACIIIVRVYPDTGHEH